MELPSKQKNHSLSYTNTLNNNYTKPRIISNKNVKCILEWRLVPVLNSCNIILENINALSLKMHFRKSLNPLNLLQSVTNQ